MFDFLKCVELFPSFLPHSDIIKLCSFLLSFPRCIPSHDLIKNCLKYITSCKFFYFRCTKTLTFLLLFLVETTYIRADLEMNANRSNMAYNVMLGPVAHCMLANVMQTMM